MLIDWFTVAAQALNFLILVWLMKRFLYKPILNAIDAREKLIAKELADADAAAELLEETIGRPVLRISSVAGKGLPQLLQQTVKLLDELQQPV